MVTLTCFDELIIKYGKTCQDICHLILV